VRLNLGEGLAPFIDSSDDHVSLTVLRDKELCGDLGAGSDVLLVDGTDVINTTTAPCVTVGGSAVAFFVFDDNSDGVSNVNSVPFPFGLLAFLTATDLFIPSTPPGTVSVVTVPRGGTGASRTVNVPNTPSTEARLVVRLNDFEQ
jgi:hypothetical protein